LSVGIATDSGSDKSLFTNENVFCNNAPISQLDYNGLYITHEGSRMKLSINIVNTIVSASHARICVNQWRYTDSDCTGYPDIFNEQKCLLGKVCYSFRYTDTVRPVPRFVNKWLGWNISLGYTCSIMQGTIYDELSYSASELPFDLRNSNDTDVINYESTTMEEDKKFKEYLDNRVGTKDIYALNALNCRRYSEFELATAPNHW
jgi:hypothetical protein